MHMEYLEVIAYIYTHKRTYNTLIFFQKWILTYLAVQMHIHPASYIDIDNWKRRCLLLPASYII